MSDFKFIKDASEIELPAEFVCPICTGKVVIDEITEWEQNEDSTWQVSDAGLSVNCEHEPEIGTPEWNGWMGGHWSMPYVDWLPVSERVLTWINRRYRWVMK